MTNQHPITPPPELLQQWATEYWGNPGESIGCGEKYIATQSAQWGADQELEACCKWVESFADWGDLLLQDRRPKPPTLKEQALTALHAVATGANDTREQHQDLDTIRKALEQLNDE